MYSKVELVEGTKGRGKQGMKYRRNNEIHHICMGTRQRNTLKIVKQNRVGEKSKEVQLREVTLP
jgi:ureidoglycolate hydrolase